MARCVRDAQNALATDASAHQHSPLRLALRLQRRLQLLLGERRVPLRRRGRPRRRLGLLNARACHRGRYARRRQRRRRRRRRSRRRLLGFLRLLRRRLFGVRHVVHSLHAGCTAEHARPRVVLRRRRLNGARRRRHRAACFRGRRCGDGRGGQRALGGGGRRRGGERSAQLSRRQRGGPRRRCAVRARQALEALLVAAGVAPAARVHFDELRRQAGCEAQAARTRPRASHLAGAARLDEQRGLAQLLRERQPRRRLRLRRRRGGCLERRSRRSGRARSCGGGDRLLLAAQARGVVLHGALHAQPGAAPRAAVVLSETRG